MLGWLTGHVAPPAPPRYFLCKLLPPRPSFMLDMSETERAAMGAHVVYWREKLAQGHAVVFGPVADPNGGWGVGVIAVPDEAALQAFQAGDPAIKADIGLRYEALPMLTAVY